MNSPEYGPPLSTRGGLENSCHASISSTSGDHQWCMCASKSVWLTRSRTRAATIFVTLFPCKATWVPCRGVDEKRTHLNGMLGDHTQAVTWSWESGKVTGSLWQQFMTHTSVPLNPTPFRQSTIWVGVRYLSNSRKPLLDQWPRRCNIKTWALWARAAICKETFFSDAALPMRWKPLWARSWKQAHLLLATQTRR
jgi:hypothetical protein